LCIAQYSKYKEAYMKLARVIASSRRLVKSQVKKPATLDMRRVALIAIKSCEKLTRHRDQTISAAPQNSRTATLMSQPRLVDLISDCIGEISGLALRHSDLTLSVKAGTISIEGSNPIYLPEDVLTLPALVRMRCLAMDVRPSLLWNQGVGPVLTLVMPLKEKVLAALGDSTMNCEAALDASSKRLIGVVGPAGLEPATRPL
jgi:hypothetical protein